MHASKIKADITPTNRFMADMNIQNSSTTKIQSIESTNKVFQYLLLGSVDFNITI